MGTPFHLTVEHKSDTEYHLIWERTRNAKVFRSTEKSDNYEEVADLTNVSQYTDEPTTRPKTRTTYFYKVDLYDGNGNVEDKLGPEAAKPAEIDEGAIYVRNQAARHFRRIGQKSYLFERNDSGSRCKKCWDEDRKVQTRKNCDNCGGSGYVEGWSSPIPLYLSYSLEQPKPQKTQGGKLESQQVQAQTSATPRLTMGDYVVRERDYEVYEVIQQQPTRKGPHILRQNVILKMVEKGSAPRKLANEIPS